MNEDQKRELESFLGQTEGTPPPVFVGRRDVLEDIAQAAGQVWKGAESGRQGMGKATRIVQGAPGAGKSSILSEVARNPERLGGSDGRVPMVVVLKSGDIRGPVDILMPLAARMYPEKAHEFMARISKNTGGEAGFGLGLFRFVRKRETGIEHAQPDADWSTFGAWVRQHGGFYRPIILAIDEAQRLDYDRKHPIAKLLQGLHDGCGLPIALVLAGLSDTEYSAGRMDLTRIPARQIHGIGCFPEPDAEDFMARSCSHFGIDITGFEGEVARLTRPCDGWPRHLHIVLETFGREVLRTGGDLGGAEWERVRAEISAGRDGYYGHQQSEQMETSARLTANVMSGLTIGIGRADVIDLIEKNIGEHPSDRLPVGMNAAEEFLIHLIHRGALQRDDKKRYGCPISSFRTYLIEQGGIVSNSSTISNPV